MNCKLHNTHNCIYCQPFFYDESYDFKSQSRSRLHRLRTQPKVVYMDFDFSSVEHRLAESMAKKKYLVVGLCNEVLLSGLFEPMITPQLVDRSYRKKATMSDPIEATFIQERGTPRAQATCKAVGPNGLLILRKQDGTYIERDATWHRLYVVGDYIKYKNCCAKVIKSGYENNLLQVWPGDSVASVFGTEFTIDWEPMSPSEIADFKQKYEKPKFFEAGTWLTRIETYTQKPQYCIVKDYAKNTCWWTSHEDRGHWIDGTGCNDSKYGGSWEPMDASEIAAIVARYGDPRSVSHPTPEDHKREHIAKALYEFAGGRNWGGMSKSFARANKAHFLDMASAVMKVI